MSSLADLPEVVGFFSYSREDDEAFKGALSALRNAIHEELSAKLGRSKTNFRLWQDQEAIAYGELWESKIKEAVEQAVFFIPIVTPRAVNSHYCKFEFNAFLAREKMLDRADLVFPLLYIRVPALENEAHWREDSVLSIIGKRQYLDWQRFRYLDIDTTDARGAIGRFCDKIVEALSKPCLPAEERPEKHEIAAGRPGGQQSSQYEEQPRSWAQELVGGPAKLLTGMPDGLRALSCNGYGDNTIVLWDLRTGAELRAVRVNEGSVSSLAGLPDGRRVLCGFEDGVARLYDLGTSAELKRFEGHNGRICSIAILPDGRRALTGSSDRTIRLWDLETGAELRRFKLWARVLRVLSGVRINSLALLPSGQHVLSSFKEIIQLRDLNSGAELLRFDAGNFISSVAPLPDGRRALSCPPLRLWDLYTGTELRRFGSSAHSAQWVAALPDGQRAFWGHEGRFLCLWDLDTGAELRRFHDPHYYAWGAVAVLQGGSRALYASGRSEAGKFVSIIRVLEIEPAGEDSSGPRPVQFEAKRPAEEAAEQPTSARATRKEQQRLSKRPSQFKRPEIDFALGAITGTVTAGLMSNVRLERPEPSAAGALSAIPELGAYVFPGLIFGAAFAIVWIKRGLQRHRAAIFAIAAFLANAAAVSVTRVILIWLSNFTDTFALACSGLVAGALNGGLIACSTAKLLPPRGWYRLATVGAALGLFLPLILVGYPAVWFLSYIIWQAGYAAALATTLRLPNSGRN